ncbi:DUF3817 domain-containing protein [Corynebacterium uberis]|uniref:DUF3817 domain-containing protein n=1 Tax=Corynebacterium TaxID=1716 RepID=UPI001D0AFC27|nr:MULTISPECIES: DUF3817 domain-containing protein [Corynebacterium]MCZ9310223.1 DUF3817 domain-containing protein [Corynebacterium sp. c6VSa_13]UDL73699.1 DUF3817 domain-containing protein [Corynebacterium uberis]UDL75419.1 DUF3817 domain-containing protein [Corynebacterium uberis]UDL77632.1 DUF3817 domain-containing protein [Corynebacterium uberis]UDL79917.1 DUF3817 domain-containing protein [Corynebacterium uberis]
MTSPDQPTTPVRVHPERQRRVRQALTIFTIAAWVTGTLLLCLCVRMVCQYLLHMELPEWAGLIAKIHGWAYICFLAATLNLGLKARWEPARWITTAISGVVPFLSFFVEHWRRREVTKKFQLN